MLRALARGSRDARRRGRVAERTVCGHRASGSADGVPCACGRVREPEMYVVKRILYTVSAQDWFSQFILSYAEARRDPERHFERETVKTLPDTLSRLNSDCDSPRGGARGPCGPVAYLVTRQDAPRACHTWYECCILSTTPPRAHVQLQGSLQQTAGTAAQAGVWSRLESPREERSVRSIDCLPSRPASSGSAEAEQGHEVAGLGLGLGRRRKRPRPRLSCSVHGKREEREQHCGG